MGRAEGVGVITQKVLGKYLACPARLERATYGLEGRCSIQLSYGQVFEVGIIAERNDSQ